MLFGTLIQTIILLIISYKTDWDKQVTKLILKTILKVLKTSSDGKNGYDKTVLVDTNTDTVINYF